MKYNWQYSDWAKFNYSDSVLESLLIEFAFEIGEIKGIIQSLSNEKSTRYHFTNDDFRGCENF